jgi:STE24 endopeptidase
MLEMIVGVYTLYTLLKLYISFMQIGYIKEEKLKPAVLMEREKYVIAANYALAKEKLSIVSTFVDYLLFFVWVAFGFAWLNSLLPAVGSEVEVAVLFMFGFMVVNFIVGLPFELYEKFHIDKAFGFTTMGIKTFVIDTLKSALLFVVLGGGVIALLAWVVSSFDSWWIVGFLVMFAVVLLANLLAPTFMALFNTFSPLEEGELKREIERIMHDAGLNNNGIFVMDASKRDSRANAFFGGLGKTKRVVLFDTLIEKLNVQELLAVLGHELGHFTHKDIWKNIGLMALLLFIAFWLFGNLPDSTFVQMGLEVHAGVKLALFMLLLSPLGLLFTPFISFVSRHNEYAADVYGSEVGGKENLVNALLKLVTTNKSFPKAHPLVIFFYHTHPPILERLKALGYDATGVVLKTNEG